MACIGKLKGLFGGGSSSESSTAASGSTDGASSTTSSASSATADAEKEKPTKASVKEEKIPLTIDVKFVSVPPMTVEEKRTARDRLVALLHYHVLS
jgi:hypoxia up-regulated 1